jgi:hypothetical protein
MKQMDPQVQEQIEAALTQQRLYYPGNVFTHPPEYYDSNDDRYVCKIHIVKWNTRSTRMTVLWARLNEKKQKWIFARKPGLRRTAHGEKMR